MLSKALKKLPKLEMIFPKNKNLDDFKFVFPEKLSGYIKPQAFIFKYTYSENSEKKGASIYISFSIKSVSVITKKTEERRYLLNKFIEIGIFEDEMEKVDFFKKDPDSPNYEMMYEKKFKKFCVQNKLPVESYCFKQGFNLLFNKLRKIEKKNYKSISVFDEHFNKDTIQTAKTHESDIEQNLYMNSINCEVTLLTEEQLEKILKFIFAKVLKIEDDGLINNVLKSNFARKQSDEELLIDNEIKIFLNKCEKNFDEDLKYDFDEFIKKIYAFNIDINLKNYMLYTFLDNVEIQKYFPQLLIDTCKKVFKSNKISYSIFPNVAHFRILRGDIAFNYANEILIYRKKLKEELESLLKTKNILTKDVCLEMNKIAQAKEDEIKLLKTAFYDFAVGIEYLYNEKFLLKTIFARITGFDKDPEPGAKLDFGVDFKFNFYKPKECLNFIFSLGTKLHEKNKHIKKLENKIKMYEMNLDISVYKNEVEFKNEAFKLEKKKNKNDNNVKSIEINEEKKLKNKTNTFNFE